MAADPTAAELRTKLARLKAEQKARKAEFVRAETAWAYEWQTTSDQLRAVEDGEFRAHVRAKLTKWPPEVSAALRASEVPAYNSADWKLLARRGLVERITYAWGPPKTRWAYKGKIARQLLDENSPCPITSADP